MDSHLESPPRRRRALFCLPQRTSCPLNRHKSFFFGVLFSIRFKVELLPISDYYLFVHFLQILKLKMESESLLMNSMEPTKFEKIEMVKIKVEWCVKDMFFMPSEYAETHADEEKAKCRLTVYVQSSSLETLNTLDFNGKIIILTVHDVGTNPLNSFIPMINMKLESIAEFREKIFLHLCVPGQENGANNFDGSFPTMEQMAEIIPQVLGHFRVKKCIALGEGAGADIICRFAMEYPEMLDGILLIHSTSSTHGFIENIKEILTNFQIEDGKMNGVGWDYLLAHRFGEDSKRNHRQHWIDQIRRNGLNEHNLSRYLYNFSYRSDFTDMLKKNLLRVRTVLVTGSKSPHNKSVYHMFEELDKTISAILVAEDVLDVVKEAPEYIGQGISLLLSDQLPQMPMPTQLVERQNSNNNTFTNVQKCFDRIAEFFCHGERRTRNGPTLQMRV